MQVTPGVATAVSATSVTINGNDGAPHTYTIDGTTFTHSKTVATGDQVVVVTLNNSGTARALVAVTGDWQGPHGAWH